ncbi:hypothetical protein EYR40_010849 [Pleurotus pulmonarius]|nr:hypothetical protein EYR36_002619 [Pleurotus pulmonarius]KAF4586833.1 hypothetical protein EYR40_010849 [Pleurotus pulmonarius]
MLHPRRDATELKSVLTPLFVSEGLISGLLVTLGLVDVLGITAGLVGSVNAVLGLTCSSIAIGGSCTAQQVCCENVVFRAAQYSRNWAIACVGAITLAGGGMYAAGRDTQAKEGNHKYARPGDAPLNSSEVAAAVKIPRPGDDRAT